MKKISAFLSLFTSVATLVCCAIPALLVALGMGAVLVGAVSVFPQLVWLSEHKTGVFALAGLCLLAAGLVQWRQRKVACQVDSGEACATTRELSRKVYIISLLLFLIGGFFAYGPFS